MPRVLALSIGLLLALCPTPVAASSAWGSPGYGDPPGWCTNFSDMWVATVVTNDPHVGTNPEQDTFYGFHPNPGYDDWYGYFYGDFRGSPGDASGWTKLLHENYPSHFRWNFATNGWAVHGHAKEYIAYYNWTFGGQCGFGAYGRQSPPPFMADQYGYPVVDIYVDSMPPYPPQPRVTDITTSSVAFTWDPVDDQGDGAGRDFFSSGIDHYTSWLTLNGLPNRLQPASTNQPRTLALLNMAPRDLACVHVVAFDKLQNATAERVACAGPLAPPPMPVWSAATQVVANPTAPGLVGLDSWFWLAPTPVAMTVHEAYRGIEYVVIADPIGADWNFGDGAVARYPDASGYGQAYPRASSVTHTYQAHNQAGYRVKSSVRYAVTWTALIQNRPVGPYGLGTVSLDARPLPYPVEQAQPELVELWGRGQDATQPTMPSIATATTGPVGIVLRYWA
ncbi:MAG: hypothetical protein M3003_17675 [Candidatus Dormibacteraeota bacterium]|nr:hypothetical protein [Candidatus Dormibacteraeota bacterium]